MAGVRTAALSICTLSSSGFFVFIFFFQAEDGIRVRDVTGVRRVLFRSTALFLDVFRSPIPQGCARFLVGFQNLRSFHLSALPALAFRALDIPPPKLLPVPDRPKPELPRSLRLSAA